MRSKWFLRGWMFGCCIWDETWILNEVDCNLNFCLDLAVFFLDENSSFLLFLCDDMINQLIKRGTILFSHPVMVKESICKDRMRFSKWSSFVDLTPSYPGFDREQLFPLWDWNPMFSASCCINNSCIGLLSSVSVTCVFAGHLPSKSSFFQMMLWNYPI